MLGYGEDAMPPPRRQARSKPPAPSRMHARFPLLQNVHAGCGVAGSGIERIAISKIRICSILASIFRLWNTPLGMIWTVMAHGTYKRVRSRFIKSRFRDDTALPYHLCRSAVEALWKITNRRGPRRTRDEGAGDQLASDRHRQ